MRAFFPIIFAIVVILLFGLFEILLLRILNRDWWEKPAVRRFAWGLPVAGAVLVLLWTLGVYNSIGWLTVTAASLAALTMILELSLMLTLPVSGLMHAINRMLDRMASKKKGDSEDRPIDQHRRLFLKGAAAAIPAATIAMSVTGVGRAFGCANVYEKKILIEGLPADLVGLKVLHLSDLHLAHYVTLHDLEQTLEAADPFKPELILVTGDVADDLRKLPDALKMIDELKPAHGAFASLGNHEYFRGIRDVKQMYAESPVSLLVNQGVPISVGQSTLHLAGVDDPRRMGQNHYEFFSRTVDTAMQESRSDDFKLLMSHRPDAFDYASEQNVNLTLAGHTHGGQIGMFGRSIFESYSPESYLWGQYTRGKNHLYTSSGMGHWFPFRLGCPPEAPVITLERA